MLHNFGGTLGMFGSAQIINQVRHKSSLLSLPPLFSLSLTCFFIRKEDLISSFLSQRTFEARNMNNSTMIGIGLTPEGINQNYVIYELMTEMAYRHHPVDLDVW